MQLRVPPNPSSIHALGLDAKKNLEKARKEVAGVLNARHEEIIFTSNGTESNNLAIQGVVLTHLGKMPHIYYNKHRTSIGFGNL